jgi:hypothetical protein
MAPRKLSRNAPCPCGSGKKYKHCCWDQGFAWVQHEQGQIFREVPLTAEVRAALETRRDQLRQRYGREPGAEDLLFGEAPPLEQVEHQIVEAMKRAGLAPAFIYAFEQTGLLVTEDNQHLIPERDLEAWHTAVARYNAQKNLSS